MHLTFHYRNKTNNKKEVSKLNKLIKAVEVNFQGKLDQQPVPGKEYIHLQELLS